METYTIGQAAARTGRTVSALRYYDKEGLLPFVERSAGGQRLFKEEDFAYISMIDCLKNTGVPIRDIKQYIDWCMEGDATLQQRHDLFVRQQARVQQQIEALQADLEKIQYKIWYYERALERGTEAGPPRQLRSAEGRICPPARSRSCLNRKRAARCRRLPVCMFWCFALYVLYRKGCGAVAQRSRMSAERSQTGTKKPHGQNVWIQARHRGLPLTDLSVVFAENHIVDVETDELVIHHIVIPPFLLGYVYSVVLFPLLVQRKSDRRSCLLLFLFWHCIHII